MVGILVIGSYIYHSDVIVTNMQVYANIIQNILLTIYQFIAYIQTSTRCHSIPQISSSVLCRL